MNPTPEQLSATARRAAQSRDWATVEACAREILRRDAGSAEGHFLTGLVKGAARLPIEAAQSFARALQLDAGRYDAAVELAANYARQSRYAEAVQLLERYAPQLGNSPRYLNEAGLTYTILGLHERAWPLYAKANELQPGVPALQANLAACDVYLGRIEEAKAAYTALLERAPGHQRNHYELSRLARATDTSHIEQMQQVLASAGLPPDRNIFLYYAIGKELEDLGRWAEAFRYYQMAGDAVTAVSPYDVSADIVLIDRVIEVCDARWLQEGSGQAPASDAARTPIFIVGLPRTGTTLTERILSSHSRVESIGETFAMPQILQQVSGVDGTAVMSPAVIAAAAGKDIGLIADGYLQAVSYRLGDKPLFIEKLPENMLYLGFIAKAYPHARLVHLRRNPMDACFALYKQSFFRFAYTLDNLGRYYVAHDRLVRHWRSLLGARMVEVEYEALIADQEGQTRRLLERLGLEFEPACLDFDRNETAIATASSAQVREKIHSRSVGRWKKFENELQPLRNLLEEAGIKIES